MKIYALPQTLTKLTISTGPLLLPDGTVAAPALAGSSFTTTGLYWTAGPSLNLVTSGVIRMAVTQTQVRIFPSSTGAFLVLSNSTPLGFAADASTVDAQFARDAADTIAQKRTTNAQTFNTYGSEITTGTRYSRLAIKHATTSVTAAVGATVTATALIPAKANVLGCNTVVTTALGTSTGTTGYTVGDGTDADRWGSVTGTADGTDTDQTDATADPTGWFTAANNVVLTALTGNFDGTGVILVDVAYTMTEAE